MPRSPRERSPRDYARSRSPRGRDDRDRRARRDRDRSRSPKREPAWGDEYTAKDRERERDRDRKRYDEDVSDAKEVSTCTKGSSCFGQNATAKVTLAMRSGPISPPTALLV